MASRLGKLSTLLLAVPLALTVAACSGGGSNGPSAANAKVAATDPAIIIGTTLPLTGLLASLGQPLRAGYEREIAGVNAAGGVAIGGTREKLRLVVLDNAGDPSTAAAQAAELVQRDHAVALLGGATAPIVTPAAVVAEQLHVPFITSLMPVEAFASGDKTGWTYSWDLFYDEQQQAAAAAKALAAAPGDKKVALFTDDDPDSVVERPLYQAAFTAAGLHVVGDYTFPAGTKTLAPYVSQAKAAGAQLVAGQLAPADAATLGRQLAASGFRPKAAFVAGTAEAGYQPPSLGSTAGQMLTPAYWTPAQASPGQLARISPTLGATYAHAPGYAPAALGYAVAEVLTDALTAAASTSPATLNAAIGRTHAPTTAGLITFNATTHTATTAYHVTG